MNCAVVNSKLGSEVDYGSSEAALTQAMRAVLNDVNREDQVGRHLDEFRVGMRIIERKVEQLEAKIAMFKGESAK